MTKPIRIHFAGGTSIFGFTPIGDFDESAVHVAAVHNGQFVTAPNGNAGEDGLFEGIPMGGGELTFSCGCVTFRDVMPGDYDVRFLIKTEHECREYSRVIRVDP